MKQKWNPLEVNYEKKVKNTNFQFQYNLKSYNYVVKLVIFQCVSCCFPIIIAIGIFGYLLITVKQKIIV